MEFKGTKGKWTLYQSKIPSNDKAVTHSVYVGTKRISLCYDLYESDKSKNVEEKTGQANALLISKAPEMLEMLEKLYQQVDFSFESFGSDTGLKMQEKIEQLIKEATEI
jgi:hypothetical protein